MLRSSPKSCLRNLASWMADAKAMYSASQVDNATVGCFLLFQEMAGPFSDNLKTCPVMLFQSADYPQSASQYPKSFNPSFDFLKVSLFSLVPFRWRITCLAIERWELVGFDMY